MIMKKVFTIATVIGLVAVPSVAFASHGSSNSMVPPAGNAQQANQQNANENENENEAEPEVNDQNDNDQNQQNDQNNQTPAATTITLDQAKATAQAQMPGKTITKVEQENEEGSTVFSVRFSDGSRVDVDGTTGAVVRSEDNAAQMMQAQSNSSDSNSGSGRHGGGDSGHGHN
jgi:uncharacterized membrane protein YkoI